MAQTTAAGLPTIGDVVLAWRKFRGLRSTELVQKAGIKKGYLSALEHNKRATPQEAYLAKLAKALDVPLQDLYGRRMPPKDGAVGTTPSSKQGVPAQGKQQFSSATGAFGAGDGLDAILSSSRTVQQQIENSTQQHNHNIGFLTELEQMAQETQLTSEKRILAERLIVENARLVYQVLAKGQDQERR
jgi:transcriptional regulator with XRE-family HTH domain